MLSIIKYQLRDRRNLFLLKGGILLVLHLIVWSLGAREIFTARYSLESTAGFWLFIAGAYTTLLLFGHYFSCGSGHASSLLYKDTGYLMLAIPLRGWQILGGRFIAGLIEFLAYALLAFVCIFIHATLFLTLKAAGSASFIESALLTARHIFDASPSVFGKAVLIMLSAYASLGLSLTFAFVLSRSFVRNRALSLAGTAAVFIVLVNVTTRCGTALARTLNWTLSFPFSVWAGSPGGSPLSLPDRAPIVQTLVVPIAPFLLYPIFALILFALASWLMERKVEL